MKALKTMNGQNHRKTKTKITEKGQNHAKQILVEFQIKGCSVFFPALEGQAMLALCLEVLQTKYIPSIAWILLQNSLKTSRTTLKPSPNHQQTTQKPSEFTEKLTIQRHLPKQKTSEVCPGHDHVENCPAA